MSALEVKQGIEWLLKDSGFLRDYFAGQALAGLMADPEGIPDRAPEVAYEVADEMLRVREQ